MKIRTDFVTNSSSSSYIVEITVTSTKGESTGILIDPTDRYIGGGGDAKIDINESELRSVNSVFELYTFLLKSVELHDFFLEVNGVDVVGTDEKDLYSLIALTKIIEKRFSQSDFEECNGCMNYFKEVKAGLDEFLHDLMTYMPNISDIEKIEISQSHRAWGEFYDEGEFLNEFLSFINCDSRDPKEIKKCIDATLANHEYYDEERVANFEHWYEAHDDGNELSTTYNLKDGTTTKKAY